MPIQNWGKNAFLGTRAFKLNEGYAEILNCSLFCENDDVNVVSEGSMIVRWEMIFVENKEPFSHPF